MERRRERAGVVVPVGAGFGTGCLGRLAAARRSLDSAAVKRPRDERVETPSTTTADGALHLTMALASCMFTQDDEGT